MTHYETLGVPTNATPEDIKAGYRRAARKAHPDKGGSDEKMAKVNKAYEVLGNAEARVHYDQFGEDPGAPQDGATEMLIELFSLAINACDGDVVKFVNGRLKDATDEIRQRREACDRKIKSLTKKAGRVKTKGSAVNLFQMLLESRINEQKSLLVAIGRTAETVQQAIALMDHYESGYVEPAPDLRAGSTGREIEMLMRQQRDAFFRETGAKP
jgi:curved DNA-binding protein CbpA